MKEQRYSLIFLLIYFVRNKQTKKMDENNKQKKRNIKHLD